MTYFTIFIFLCSALVSDLVQCEVYRLPKDVKPIRYFLTMKPELADGPKQNRLTFHRNVTIELEMLKNTNTIILHKSEIQIDNREIVAVSSNGEEFRPRLAFPNTSTETFEIEFYKELLENEKYNLTIGVFDGILNNVENGFAKAVYFNNGKPRILALTYFEPTGARRAFPCFDEPALKAKFTISLIREKRYHSLSTMELDFTEPLEDGWFKDTFKETPAMSTYNVAFAVSDLNSTDRLDRLRVFATEEEIEQGRADGALEVGAKLLRVLEEYMDVNFTLSKLDQFAVPPRNIEGKAMENWGLIVYDAPQILHNNQSSASVYQKGVFMIAHELAHQWFGNLVTPEWWDYLWLNESFASYFHYYIVGIIQPTWKTMDQFVIDKVQGGLRSEEMGGAYPLNFVITREGQTPPNHIIYNKGAAILRMIEHFLTHDVFKKALQMYLKANQFGATVPSDLYKAFQEAVDEANVPELLQDLTVTEILETWFDKKGYPIVTVTRNYTSGFVTIDQKSEIPTESSSSPWIIPITYVFSDKNTFDFSKTTTDYWLTNKSVSINDNFPTEGWLIINKQQIGYYRVNYDRENWNRITEFLNTESFSSIHPANRAQLIDDAFNLAFREELPWEVPLRLCEYIIRERDYIPLVAFVQSLNSYVFLSEHRRYGRERFEYFKNYTLSNAIDNNPNATEFEVYKEYLQTVLSGVSKHLGFEPKPTDTHMDKLTRAVYSSFRNILT